MLNLAVADLHDLKNIDLFPLRSLARIFPNQCIADAEPAIGAKPPNQRVRPTLCSFIEKTLNLVTTSQYAIGFFVKNRGH